MNIIPTQLRDIIEFNDFEMFYRYLLDNGMSFHAYLNFFTGKIPEEYQLKILKEDITCFPLLSNPSEEAKEYAVLERWDYIALIDTPSAKLQCIATKQNSLAIHHIIDPAISAELISL